MPRRYLAIFFVFTVLTSLVTTGATGQTATASDPVITSAPENPTNSTTATFEFTGEEGVSFLCRRDNEADFSSCSSPAEYLGLAEGSHTFEVKAVDADSNQSGVATYTWVIDTQPPPTPDIRAKPSDPTSSQTARFTWIDDEANVTFVCTLDGSAVTDPCPNGRTYSGLGEGTHTFAVLARDAAGNVSSPDTYAWTIDLTAPPPPTIGGKPADPTNSQAAAFSFSDSEPSVSFLCKLDTQADFIPCLSPKAYSGLTEGTRTFSVKAADDANNESDATTYGWTIDLTPPPRPTIEVSPPDVTMSTTATFTFMDSEPGVDFLCGLDGAAFAPCSSGVSYSGLKDGPHGFVVEAADEAGNVSAWESHDWTVDIAAPVVTVTSPADASATSDETPTITGLADTGPADGTVVTVLLYAGASANGTPVQMTAPVDPETGLWSVLGSTLDDGTYTVVVRQTDIFDRSGGDSNTFRVDTTVPAVTLTSPVHGLITKNPTPTFAGSAGTALGDHPQVTIVLSRTGILFKTIPDVPVADGSWSWQPAADDPLPDGSYTVVARQRDETGETGTSNANSFTIDTTAPSDLARPSVVSGYGYVMLRWTRGSDWKLKDELVIRRHRADSTKSVRRYRGTGTSFKDGRVTNGVSYVYDLFAVDAAGNRSPTLSRTARPTGFRAPQNGSLVSNPPEIRWVDVANSTYSNIQVWNARLTVKMLSVWPTDRRYALRSRWTYAGHVYRLRHGRKYKIYGWPGFGPKSASRYGESYGWVSFIYR